MSLRNEASEPEEGEQHEESLVHDVV